MEIKSYIVLLIFLKEIKQNKANQITSKEEPKSLDFDLSTNSTIEYVSFTNLTKYIIKINQTKPVLNRSVRSVLQDFYDHFNLDLEERITKKFICSEFIDYILELQKALDARNKLIPGTKRPETKAEREKRLDIIFRNRETGWQKIKKFFSRKIGYF